MNFSRERLVSSSSIIDRLSTFIFKVGCLNLLWLVLFHNGKSLSLNKRKSMEFLLSFVCSKKKTLVVQKHHSYLKNWEVLQAFFHNHVSLDTVELLKPIVHEVTRNLFPVCIHWNNLRKILACILNITKLHISHIKLHWLSCFDSKLRFFLRRWLESLNIDVHSVIHFFFLNLLLFLSPESYSVFPASFIFSDSLRCLLRRTW